MNILAKYALENNGVKVDKLINLLECLEERMRPDINFLVAYLVGMTDVDNIKFPDLAIVGESKRKGIFVKYNLLEDEVEYLYDTTNRLWFRSAEDAAVYADGKNYHGLDYAYIEKDDFTYPAERTYQVTGTCPRTEWLAGAISE